jgi:hypothetical protein
MNRLVRFAARALEPGENEAVLGDLAECGASGGRALLDVLGLVARRQLLIWTSWRPWVALIGIVGVSGFCLSSMLAGLSIGIFEQLTAWLRYGVHYNIGVTSFRDDVIQMSCLAAAIFCWTAVNASLLRRLSGRASWLTALLFYLVVVDSASVRLLLSGNVASRGNAAWWSAIRWVVPMNPESICIVLFLIVIPAVCGARGKLPGLIPATVVCTLAAAWLGEMRAHDLQRFSQGEFPAASWFAILVPYALVSWPVLARFVLTSQACRQSFVR